ncbi:hypothetical protein [Pyxidicoccus xibeiensis]|uniref:hypothetical protein n=1 Tax=Pyxidicoccus xibeiensis TaxID=2906759 RepID=UPI0020A6E3C8|nr:hypothetical protein [Pyxidicoccus xibeiensis]MCP3137412.1 hypothetical protein [Pyxidicoccus xibeiensis]
MSLAGGTEWLQLWERAVPGPPRRRRRELLASAGARGAFHPAQLPVGRANSVLLRLHATLFGPRLDCRTACPACAQALELEVDVADLLGGEPSLAAEQARLQVDEWDMHFRLPSELDVDAAHDERDPESARRLLLQRCVFECRRGEEPVSILAAPSDVQARLVTRMEELDPLATIDFQLACGGCGHKWSSALEVDAFLWAKLDAWARRMLHEVHELARHYGWSERDVLAMSPWKRQIYLDLVAA